MRVSVQKEERGVISTWVGGLMDKKMMEGGGFIAGCFRIVAIGAFHLCKRPIPVVFLESCASVPVETPTKLI